MKNIVLMTFATIICFATLPSISMAGHHYHGCSSMHMGELSEMDTDNSGFITLDEFSEPLMKKYRGWFKMLDTDADGYISQEEWDVFRKAHGYEENSEG